MTKAYWRGKVLVLASRCYSNNPGERKTKETKNLTENSLCCVWDRTKQTRVCSSAMPMLPKAKVLLSSSGSLAAQYLVFANKPLRGSSLHGSAYGPPGFNSTPLHTAVCIWSLLDALLMGGRDVVTPSCFPPWRKQFTSTVCVFCHL